MRRASKSRVRRAARRLRTRAAARARRPKPRELQRAAAADSWTRERPMPAEWPPRRCRTAPDRREAGPDRLAPVRRRQRRPDRPAWARPAGRRARSRFAAEAARRPAPARRSAALGTSPEHRSPEPQAPPPRPQQQCPLDFPPWRNDAAQSPTFAAASQAVARQPGKCLSCTHPGEVSGPAMNLPTVQRHALSIAPRSARLVRTRATANSGTIRLRSRRASRAR